ncbi:8-amino-7-oxononanoate synthase [Pasteurella bettyae]|uniref:8-amino-7-oxononanoate synthase n=1 Tax=Pasteurella bettyae TaxID=752 RepID=UPI003D26DC16
MYSFFTQRLSQLQQQGQFRCLTSLQHSGKWVEKCGQKMLNFSSNDYLGLASDYSLYTEFMQQQAESPQPLTSSSSRLLTGNFPIYQALEERIAQQFGRESALLFNSGYHANIGILPAVADKNTLILADKLVHASLIDGILLCEAKFIRYRHNDMEHLAQLLAKNAPHFERLIVVTESLFSMDGDIADLPQLVRFKQQYSHLMLYVDEAHAIGAYGEKGLGMAEIFQCIPHIDFLVGTLGKAMASMGAYVVCDQLIKDYLINFMRPLIFSTALPPINIAWTHFLFGKLEELKPKRQHLAKLAQHLRDQLNQFSILPIPSQSGIVPFIIGDNQRTVDMALNLQKNGFYCLPIRPPTVPKGTARIRLSVTADMTLQEIDELILNLKSMVKNQK